MPEFYGPTRDDGRPHRTEYDTFDYHQVSLECSVQLAQTRRLFKRLRDEVRETVPSCRERSVALTKLQEALSAAIQAIVFTHPDSRPYPDEP